MENKIFENLKGVELIETLEANSEGLEERTYFEKLSLQELTELRSKFSDVSIEISRIEDRKKTSLDEFKLELKPFKKDADRLLTEIKTGHHEKFGRVFKMIDREAGMVGYYSESGYLVEQRTATPEERSQLTIQGQFNKAVNQ